MRPEGACNNPSTMRHTCYYSIQMQEPVETAELLAFARTVDARSLSRAAAELEVPRATKIGRAHV